MSDAQSQQSTQDSNTLVAHFWLIVISIVSALFLPAMFTFSFALPALILTIIIYVSVEKKSIGIFLIAGFFSFIFYPIIHSLFIQLFPTFVVVLITIFLIRIIPYKLDYIKKIFMFIVISFLLGMNTNIFTLMSNNYSVNEEITNVLQVSQEEIIQITGYQKEFPSSYRTHDLITFGSNEGCGCGYWVYPKIETSSIPKLLQDREIAYTLLNESPKKIDIEYKETNDIYTLTIKVKEIDKILSSLSIRDRLPYRSNINTNELESFEPRLEYLLRHNIWNGLIFYAFGNFYNIKKNNEMLISEFLKRSIHSLDKRIDWSEDVIEIDGKLLFESELKACSPSLKKDDYKDYPFMEWKKAYADKSVKTAPGYSYLFEYNNTFYTTKEHTNRKYPWIFHDFSYSNDKFVYAFITFIKDYIKIIQFSKKGKFVRELHVRMPEKSKNVIDSNVSQNVSNFTKNPSSNINEDENNLKAKDWHPISHVLITDEEMKFRVYNIYERDYQRNLCKYQYITVPLN